MKAFYELYVWKENIPYLNGWSKRGSVMYIIRRTMSNSIFRWLGLLLLIGILLPLLFMQLGFARAISPTGRPPSPARVNTTALSVEQSILDNIKQNGFDDNSQINGGLGGLWLNWQYGSNPLQTNFNDSGQPDGPDVVPPRHDELTDLRYLHSLWLYKSQNPRDTQYDSEIAKYTPIVKHEFASTGNEHGWLFDEEFMDLYRLSKDPFYLNTALSLVSHYSSSIETSNPRVGIIYETNSAHPYGYYRPDFAIEQGCALIIAGTQEKNTLWIQQGQTAINFVYAHAYIAQYHAFPDQLDQVLLPGGGVNPSETFYLDSSKDGSLMKAGSTAQIIIALLHTYQATRSIGFLNDAVDLLNARSLPNNALSSMWDPTYLGYYQQVKFTRTGPEAPGSLTLDTTNKESGRQESILWALHLANLLTARRYLVLHTREMQMQTVVLTKAYYAPGHGVLYEMTKQWTPVTINNHPATWVTTEAMGIELESLMEETGNAIY
jgi:hypothetical protein